MLREAQLRLVYSLLKPALRMASRFDIPVRGLVELVRLGYFEVLSRRGMSAGDMARAFGQTPRHLRSLARRFRSDFFLAETQVGLVREIEELVAARTPTRQALAEAIVGVDEEAMKSAIDRLIGEERIERLADGRLQIGRRYVVMTSEGFVQRIDALNHHLDGLYRATVQRLIHDERHTAMIKTITISAVPEELAQYLKELEGELRRRLAELEESATFRGLRHERFTIGLSVAASEDGEKP